MTNSDYPWEPPLAGTEVEQIVGALNRLRTTFRWKAGGLDAEGLQTRIGASSLTIGGLLKHLAFVEDYTFTTKMKGESPGEPWESTFQFTEDWVFHSAADETPQQLYELWDNAVERSHARLGAALADGGFDQLVDISDNAGRHPSLRRLVCDLIEEYGRHTGHADLLREAVDGLVGEDPPAGWSAGPVVTLREISDDNRAAIEALSVTETQDQFVAGVAESIQEAAELPDAKPWYRAVYADEEPVGFVMISDGITVDNPDFVGPYYLWRLLIDARFQGRGYGTAALDLVIEHVRTRPDARVVLTSHVVGPDSPVTFYQQYGFRLTGDVHQGEPLLELDLYPGDKGSPGST